ncbi:MAG TPA: CHAT domain-containing protein [Pseudonocardiaceae bacterium]|nr:CHAT domain-containing protein [Pseudonocardiaceae bacterium]
MAQAPRRGLAERLRQAEEKYRRGWEANNAWHFAEGARFLRSALRLIDGNDSAEAIALRTRTLITLAYSDNEARGPDSALDVLAQAESLLTGVDDDEIRLDLTARIAGQRGVVLLRANRWDDSVTQLSIGIAIRDRAYAAGEPVHVRLAIDLMNRANVNNAAGHPGPATRDYHRMVEVVASGRYDSRVDQEAISVLDAKAQHGLAAVAWRVGDIPQALAYYEKAQAGYAELMPSGLPKLRMDQAETLLTAGLAEEAARQLDDALPELQRVRNLQNVAEAELLRAAAAFGEGDLRGARTWAESARRRFHRHGNESLAARAALVRLRADVAEAQDGGRISAKLIARARALAETLAGLDLIDQSGTARMLAVLLELGRGRTEAAAEQFALVPALRRVTPVDQRMLRRLCLAELAVARGDRRTAFAQARAGVAELGRIRDRMGGAELVSGTAVHGRALGQLAVRLVVEHSRSPARALFGWLERTRAQLYRYQPLPAPDDPVLAEKVSEYRYLSRQLQQARLSGRPSRDLIARHAALGREVMQGGWRDSPWGQPRPIATVAEVIAALDDRAMISFLVTGGAMMAVVIVGGAVRLVRLGEAGGITEAAQDLHADLDALSPDWLPAPLAQAVTNSAVRRAGILDERLLRPLESLIGGRELVIIPTGALYAVAWGALPRLRGRPVVVAPSATAWLTAQRSDTEAGSTVLVGGPNLSAVIGELTSVRRFHPGAETITMAEASVERVLKALDGAGLAHVAAHGAHEPENALFSRLELLDGALFAHEMIRLRRPPRHVVLAACELALSRIRPGDEALGFAGALLAGGGRTVTAAVSRVGDQAAASAMDDYHRQLADGAPAATALAQATSVDPFRRPFICLGAG